MDDRVGLYDDIYIDFSNDTRARRQLPYIVRWNFDPADSTRPSTARHPMVIYLSNTIPPAYRGAIRDACLEWNKAFEKIGILDAIIVRDQPSDPNWDPDDVRYSVIRWLDETRPSFGADSQTLFNPLTGEEIRTGVLVSAVVGSGSASRMAIPCRSGAVRPDNRSNARRISPRLTLCNARARDGP